MVIMVVMTYTPSAFIFEMCCMYAARTAHMGTALLTIIPALVGVEVVSESDRKCSGNARLLAPPFFHNIRSWGVKYACLLRCTGVFKTTLRCASEACFHVLVPGLVVGECVATIPC